MNSWSVGLLLFMLSHYLSGRIYSIKYMKGPINPHYIVYISFCLLSCHLYWWRYNRDKASPLNSDTSSKPENLLQKWNNYWRVLHLIIQVLLYSLMIIWFQFNCLFLISWGSWAQNCSWKKWRTCCASRKLWISCL